MKTLTAAFLSLLVSPSFAQVVAIRAGTVVDPARGMHNAQLVLNQGFTTLRDVGNSAEYAMSDVRRAIDAGWFIGPHHHRFGQDHRALRRPIARHTTAPGRILAVRVHRCRWSG